MPKPLGALKNTDTDIDGASFIGITISSCLLVMGLYTVNSIKNSLKVEYVY